MGLMDFIKKQFIDVIQWTEDEDGVLAWRFPMQDMEIQNGASLTVRDSQMAVFVNEGRVADVFAPGRYTLSTQTLPLLTNLMNWDKLFQSPFKSDVYFFSTRLQLNRKWGTPQPITIRDKDFGAVRLRAFGMYSFKISDPGVFYKEVSGTRDTYTVEELDGQLRTQMIAAMSATFGSSGVPFLDMAANQLEFAKHVRGSAEPMFARLGLALDQLAVENLSLPEEIQKALDTRMSMNMIGNMAQYTQYQTATAIPIAAANEGGLAGIGAGLGVGLGMGQAMGGAMAPAMAGMAGQMAQPMNPVQMGMQQQAAPAAAAAAAPSIDDITATLEKLHGLVTKGVLSQAEFDAKKAELLAKLG